MKEIGVGVLGFGTVGAGVVQGLLENGDLMAQRTGLDIRLKKVADLDLESDRGVKVDPALLTADADSVIQDPNVHIIVELIGGSTVAKDFVLKALQAGKAVVTANKALLAKHGLELYEASRANHADLFYEASVGGGIPIIKALREGLIANHIESMYGILNGTCNYILTRMELEGLPFDQVLSEAQAAGYAEAEPSLDVDGDDTAHKAVILASLAYGFPLNLSDIHVEGIRGLDRAELKFAADLGYRIKLLAITKQVDGDVEVRVHPTLIPLDHTLAAVSGVFNAVLVKGDVVDDTLYYGRGAGRLPTASAVLSDIVDVARNISTGASGRVPALVQHDHYGSLKPMGEIALRCYLRLTLRDEPGVMARVAQKLAAHNISIAALVQKKSDAGQDVPVIVLTHEAKEASYVEAIKEIDGMDVVGAPTVRLRIEEFDG